MADNIHEVADARAAEIMHQYIKTNGVSAADLLRDELMRDQDAMRKDTALDPNSNDRFQGYHYVLEDRLVKNGLLGKLSLDWANKDNPSDMVKDMLKDGNITMEEIDKKLAGGFEVSAFDRLMLKGLKTDFDKIAGTDGVMSSITLNDLHISAERAEKARSTTPLEEKQKEDKAAVSGLLKQMLAKPENGKSLYEELKGDDETISLEDLKKFRDARSGTYPHNEENKAFVDQLIKSWTDPKGPYYDQIQLMRGNIRTEYGWKYGSSSSALNKKLDTDQVAKAAGVEADDEAELRMKLGFTSLSARPSSSR